MPALPFWSRDLLEVEALEERCLGVEEVLPEVVVASEELSLEEEVDHQGVEDQLQVEEFQPLVVLEEVEDQIQKEAVEVGYQPLVEAVLVEL